MKIQIKQEGNAKTFFQYDGLYHNDHQDPSKKKLELLYSLLYQVPGLPDNATPQKPMLVDNETRLPMLDTNFQPIPETIQQPTGNYVMVNIGEPIGQDGQGNPIYDQVPDYGQPIMADVQVPRTIGEYDAIMWWFWDARNSQRPPVMIEVMMLQAMQRRLGASSDPYVFIATPEYLSYFP